MSCFDYINKELILFFKNFIFNHFHSKFLEVVSRISRQVVDSESMVTPYKVINRIYLIPYMV